MPSFIPSLAPSDIKIVQYMYGEFQYFHYSEKVNGSYSRRHGYNHVISRETPRSDRDITWHKVPLISQELKDCRYLLWLDADALFYSQELEIEQELIPLLGKASILFTPDIFSETKRWHPKLPCSGVILLRNDGYARDIMEAWDQSTDLDEESRWRWPPDQLGLWRHVLPVYRNRIKILADYYLMNGIYGQYIRHYPRMSDRQRTIAMKRFCRDRGIIS